MMKRFILIALLAATASAARITPADRAKAVNVNDPQISPDGKSIACVVSRVNLKDDRYDTELTLIDVATGTPRPLTFERRGVASPRWSSDGERIAFLANASNDRDAKRQLWTVSMRGGDPRRLTDAKQGVQQFAWSPDGSQIAFVSADDRRRFPRSRGRHAVARVVDQPQWRQHAPRDERSVEPSHRPPAWPSPLAAFVVPGRKNDRDYETR